ncbi:TlpA family protein disulfide reductase [Leptospira sp. WS92.C1]
MKRFLFIFSIFIFSLGTSCSETVSNFAFFNLREKRMILSESLKEFSKDDILILNFTGSTCKPCKEQVPILLNLTQKSNSSPTQKGRVFLWIIFVGDDFQTGREYSHFLNLEKHAEVLVDPLSSSYSQAGIIGLPTVLIINSKQEIIFKTEGYNEPGTEAFRNFMTSFFKNGK